VCPINPRDYLATGVQLGRKLNEKRCEKVADVLFFFVSKVKEEIHQGGVTGIAQRHDVFYDRGALVNEFSYLRIMSGKRQT
jgi:hypothetical protein